MEPPIAGAGVAIDELVLAGMGDDIVVCANAGAMQSAASAAPAAAAVSRVIKVLSPESVLRWNGRRRRSDCRSLADYCWTVTLSASSVPSGSVCPLTSTTRPTPGVAPRGLITVPWCRRTVR